MPTYSKSQILSAPADSAIPAVCVTLANVSPVKTQTRKTVKQGQSPTYTIQNATAFVNGNPVDAIPVTFLGCPDQTFNLNQPLIISSVPGRNGLRGVTARDDNYLKARVIQVWDNARIEVCQTTQSEAPPTPPESPQTSQNTPSLPHPHQTPRNAAGAKETLNRAANLFILAKRAAAYACKEAGEPYRPEDATTLFILMDKQGWVAAMPIGKLEKEHQQPAPENVTQFQPPQPPPAQIPMDDGEDVPF